MFRRNEPDDTDDEEIDHEVEEEDEDEQLDLNDAAFRQHRARIRGCSDLEDLADLRAEFTAYVSNRSLSPVARMRARDLVQAGNDRIAEVRARLITRDR